MQRIERLQKLFEILDKLGRESAPILVEGKKDKRALESFGIRNVHTLSGPLAEIPKKLNSKKVIILTDYDREGKKLAAELSKFLESEGITPDLRFKAALGKLLRVSEIEAIPKFIENLGGFMNGKDKSHCYKICNTWSVGSRWSCGRA